jgi:uncharacterized membrane protein YkoI
VYQSQTIPANRGLHFNSKGGFMVKFFALAVAIAATAGIAGAQASGTMSKSTVKTAKSSAMATHRSSAKKADSKSAMRKEAKISEKTARATALKEVPNGKIKSSELERENGKLIYSFAIAVSGKPGIEEVNVDAVDGSVVSHEHESAATEKKEAAQDKKAKK